MAARTRRQQQAEATREALIEAARALFAERGYAATSIEEITSRTGAARGALYHHFASKQALFRAVVLQVEAEMMAAMLAATAAPRDPWERIEAGCTAFLDACLDAGVRRIFLLDAPAVLTVDAEEAERFAALASAGLAGIFGDEPPPDVDVVATALLGTLNGLARNFLAHAEQPKAARQRAQRVLHQVIAGLRSPP